jgi:predicted nucleotidyltransferase
LNTEGSTDNIIETLQRLLPEEEAVDPQKINSDEVSRYWLDEAEEALTVLNHLFDKGDYSYALFFGHLWICCRADQPYSGRGEMVERSSEIEKIVKIFLDEIQRTYRLDSAYLFGSRAKGASDQWSDIDLAVVSPDFSEDLYEERLALMRLAAAIDDRIEPKSFRPEMFTPNEPLVDEIQKHGIKLF